MSGTIRDAAPADRAAWAALWQGYLAYYGVTLDPAVTDATWARLMDPASPLKARLVLGTGAETRPDGMPENALGGHAPEGQVLGGQVLGFAIHQHHPSSWVLGEDCYLEDLFVAPAARGAGLGRALIADLAALARARGWHRLYWHTRADNARARQLYDSFVESDGHIRYRMALQT